MATPRPVFHLPPMPCCFQSPFIAYKGVETDESPLTECEKSGAAMCRLETRGFPDTEASLAGLCGHNSQCANRNTNPICISRLDPYCIDCTDVLEHTLLWIEAIFTIKRCFIQASFPPKGTISVCVFFWNPEICHLHKFTDINSATFIGFWKSVNDVSMGSNDLRYYPSSFSINEVTFYPWLRCLLLFRLVWICKYSNVIYLFLIVSDL